uniref:Kinesin-like protein NACK1 n=1 Tax=Rhizophora mucronata TaxID=61149 RepID=A0A2P2PW04_RHIMU
MASLPQLKYCSLLPLEFHWPITRCFQVHLHGIQPCIFHTLF